MTKSEAYERLNEVFRDVFDDETIAVHAETTAGDIQGWDSLEHIDLIIAVENEFGLHFSMGEVNKMKNVGEMVDTILQRVGE